MSKRMAVIVDIDGTLAKKHDGRGNFDWNLVGDDIPHKDIIELVNLYAYSPNEAYVILVVSGRMDSCRVQTEQWLNKHGVAWDKLYMRKEGDFRKDAVVKLEIFENDIQPNYDVRIVIDDRDQVVEMWRSMGLRVLQVAYGNF